MPIVIHELVVTAQVKRSASSQSDASSRKQEQQRQLDKQAIIKECTEAVLKQLERQRER
jgi:phenylpyruvate tautomerase PptA (4-oxalocrotonate tautomerase family)